MNHIKRISQMLFFLLVVFSSVSWAVDIQNQFQNANQLYRDGKYVDAAPIYEAIAKERPSSEVYYNLGNTYLKDKKIGLAILNYERALRLNPRDSDILANLVYCNHLIEYKIEDKRNWYVRTLTEFLSFFTREECWILFAGAYFIFIVGFFISLLVKRRSLFGKSGTLAFGFLLLCASPALLQQSDLGVGHQAVVTGQQAEVRYGPTTSDRLAFRLVEGLKVSIKDEKQEWYRIALNDGQTGWALQSQVTAI